VQLHGLAQGNPAGVAALRFGIGALRITRAGTPPPLGELAEMLVMDRGALTHTLKPLERDGLVEICVDPDDRRNRLVALTSVGRKKLEQSMPLWKNAQDGFEAAFGVVKSAALRKALEFVVSDDFVTAFNRRG
jgi:DNA-binding MarR family transcriptional regulator